MPKSSPAPRRRRGRPDADALVRNVKDGLQYRGDLIDEALKEGVRAKGDTFAEVDV